MAQNEKPKKQTAKTQAKKTTPAVRKRAVRKTDKSRPVAQRKTKRKGKYHIGQPLCYIPDELAEAAQEYFKHRENDFFKVDDYKGKDAKRVTYDRHKPFTLTSLCNYLGISLETFSNYKKRPEYFGVCKAIEAIIYENKFDGAAAGIYNHAIIARYLGLADKKELSVKAVDQLTDEEADAEIKRLNEELNQLEQDT